MNEYNKFLNECREEILEQGRNTFFTQLTREWINIANSHKYSYHFNCLGRPIIQYPQDMIAVQELIWKVKPDLIIETGIAHGGSLIMSAFMLSILDYCDALEAGHIIDPQSPRRRVLGIDIEIRPHNKLAIETHPMSHRIDMIQGSSISSDIITQVHEIAKNYKRVFVCLDSNHTHDHVLAELEAYAPLVSKESYCLVFDSIIEDFSSEMYPNRPWSKGNNPKTAIWEYLRRLKEENRKAADDSLLRFEVDKTIENKILITVAPDGYLKRVG